MSRVQFPLQSLQPQAQWIYVKPSNASISNKSPIGIQFEEGTMEVTEDHFIPIHCDGLYVLFLKGMIRLRGVNDSLSLIVYQKDGSTKDVFILEVLCRGLETTVQNVTMSKLRSENMIYLKANHEATIGDLKLGLVMLTPHSYCHPEH
ncbi:uncharacterized protein LOC128323964 isoform X2 [Hemicordylus capensis]|uniref:uncharacterized protein LOC128323964 isoform X2 n=1 Tax=Hemicordylus capensis TaxID=884348 RepID=UPI0023047A53|nr:uncharacterized protein LOC128323964 isoform X2 [Hemicordylus capensis]